MEDAIAFMTSVDLPPRSETRARKRVELDTAMRLTIRLYLEGSISAEAVLKAGAEEFDTYKMESLSLREAAEYQDDEDDDPISDEDVVDIPWPSAEGKVHCVLLKSTLQDMKLNIFRN